jgi:symplekin
MEATQSQTWERTTDLKNTILNLWPVASLGPRIAATKLVQKIIQTQTRAVVDPRVRDRIVEPNLAMCPSHHTFMNPQALEDEAKRVLEECIKLLYISTTPDVVSSIVNAFATLVKARPALSNSIYTSLVNWEPNALSSCTPLQVRGVEKTFRIAVAHLLKSGSATAFAPQITDFLHKQNSRMLQAAEVSRKRRDDEASKKRSRITDELNSVATANASNKRRKLDPTSTKEGLSASKTFALGSKQGEEANPLADFDVTTLPVALVTELIIANLQVVTDAALASAIDEIRKHLGADSSVSLPLDQTEAREGPVNPLAEEDEDLQLPRADESDDEMEALPEEDYELPLPDLVSHDTHNALFDSAISRIFSTGLSASSSASEAEASLWIGLITRMAARHSKASDDPARPDTIRQALFTYIVQDPASRYGTSVLEASR